MGTADFVAASSIITDLSFRAIAGSSVVLFFLLLIAVLFRHNEFIKQVVFMLIVATVVFVSTILFTTAYVHVQETAAITKGLTAS